MLGLELVPRPDSVAALAVDDEVLPVVPKSTWTRFDRPAGSTATENVIGADAIAPRQQDPGASSAVPGDKRQLQRRLTETPATEPPTTKLRPAAGSLWTSFELSMRMGHPTANQTGCPVRLDAERVSAGWYIAEISNEALRVKTGSEHLSFGKHRLELLAYPFASVYIQPEPGAGWFVEHALVPRQYLPERLDGVVRRIVQVFRPARRGRTTYEVNAVAEEMTL